MNPYLKESCSLDEKCAEWGRSGIKGKNPYLKKAMEVGLKSSEWDMDRKHEYKFSNNIDFPYRFILVNGVRICLLPRVKFVYDQLSGVFVDPRELATLFRLRFTLPEYSKTPLYIDLDDVRAEPSTCSMIIYFRDFSFLVEITDPKVADMSLLDAARKFLMSQDIINITINYNRESELVYKARVPAEENVDQVIAQFEAAHPAYMKRRRPLMIVRNLFAKRWFSPSNAFKFFATFGKIRFLNVVKIKEVYVAKVEYHLHSDFVKAMRNLTGCCIGLDDTPELQEYEISLSMNEESSGIASSLHPDSKEMNKVERRHVR